MYPFDFRSLWRDAAHGERSYFFDPPPNGRNGPSTKQPKIALTTDTECHGFPKDADIELLKSKQFYETRLYFFLLNGLGFDAFSLISSLHWNLGMASLAFADVLLSPIWWMFPLVQVRTSNNNNWAAENDVFDVSLTHAVWRRRVDKKKAVSNNFTLGNDRQTLHCLIIVTFSADVTQSLPHTPGLGAFVEGLSCG